jgi:glycosyltransferase involved in cell wall biosynthesis
MKILVVVPSYDPSVGGGVASCFRTLCKGLVQVGVDVTVFTTNASRKAGPLDVPTDRTVNVSGVKIRYFPSTFGPKSLFDSRELTRKLKRTVQQYDLVYVSAIWQWIGIDTARVCHKNTVPMVVGVHGSFARQVRSEKRWKKTLFRQFVVRPALRQATAIHLTSETERVGSVDWLEGCPSFVVPNAVDPALFYAIPSQCKVFRQKHGIPEDSHIVIAVGRPDWMKRIDLLLQAIATNQRWYLLIVGPDNMGKAPEWRRLSTQLKVADRVIWAGYLEGEELLAAYSASDVFALISQSENFGMVVVEAILCGLPVMVSPEVGVWELLKNDDVGKSIPMSHHAISNALDDFASNREQWRIRANTARSIAEKRFAPDRVGALMRRAFEDILSGRRSQECHWRD